MILDNKLGITDQIEWAKCEEKISKQKAKQLFDSGDIDHVEPGTFKGLSFIHTYLFAELYSGPQYLDQYLRSDLAQNIG